MIVTTNQKLFPVIESCKNFFFIYLAIRIKFYYY